MAGSHMICSNYVDSTTPSIHMLQKMIQVRLCSTVMRVTQTTMILLIAIWTSTMQCMIPQLMFRQSNVLVSFFRSVSMLVSIPPDIVQSTLSSASYSLKSSTISSWAFTVTSHASMCRCAYYQLHTVDYANYVTLVRLYPFLSTFTSSPLPMSCFSMLCWVTVFSIADTSWISDHKWWISFALL